MVETRRLKRQRLNEDAEGDGGAAGASGGAAAAPENNELDDRKPAAKRSTSDAPNATTHANDSGRNDSGGEMAETVENGDLKPPAKRKRGGDPREGDGEGDLLPLAPSLDAYLQDGGHGRYRPRPEWCAAAGDAVSSALRLAGRAENNDNDDSSTAAVDGDRPPARRPLELAIREAREGAARAQAAVRESREALAGIMAQVVAAGNAAGRGGQREGDGQAAALQNEAPGRLGGIPLREMIRNLDQQAQNPNRLEDEWARRPIAHHRHHHRHHGRQGQNNNNGNGHEEHPAIPVLANLRRQGQNNNNNNNDNGHEEHPAIQALRNLRQELDHNPLPNPDDMAAGGNVQVDNNVLPQLLRPEPPQQPRMRGRAANQARDSLQHLHLRPEVPRPVEARESPSRQPAADASSPSKGKAAVFGFECDSALHLAIKQGATEAATALVAAGACINFPNAKGITPLMVASQEGALDIVRALLHKGALPNATTVRGSTALIQASHFGKLEVVDELLTHGARVDQANLKNTTALMRASQEGHMGVVKRLLRGNAGVNRRNDERMTALMLSSQRGHDRIVRMLVKSGAQVDAKTAQDSTSLMLACKRKHLEVARILVASGTELKLKDVKNRTVLETATRRGNAEFAEVLTDAAQVRLMQEDARRERNFEMVRVWRLFQSERATVRLGRLDVGVRMVAENLETPSLERVCPSKRVLIRAMTLPAPVMELIAQFIPLPLSFERRLELLASRSIVHPDSAVFNALDLIDEVLEVGGMLQAFDEAGVDPPKSFASWSAFQSYCGKCDVILSRCGDVDVTHLLAEESEAGLEIVDTKGGASPKNLRPIEPSATQRRGCNYLSVLARAPERLNTILSSPPYDVSSVLLRKLQTNSDIQSIVRRNVSGGISFDTAFANELVVLARMAVMWAEGLSTY
ncbi:hypothetical protein ACHAXT_011574 [Thalassiosira profunda]